MYSKQLYYSEKFMTDMKRNDSENPVHAPECTCTTCRNFETYAKEKAYPRGAVLGKADIFAKLKSEDIIIFPLNPTNVQNASVDVCLGRHFFRQRPSQVNPNFNFINPNSDDPRTKLWGDAQTATTYKAYMEQCKKESELAMSSRIISEPSNVNDDDEIIVVTPGETILCHT